MKTFFSLCRVFMLLSIASLVLPSCACDAPEKRNTIGCAVLHQVIDCTVDAALSNLGPAAAAIIAQATSGGPVNWDNLLASLEGAGIKDGGCLIAQLQNDFAIKAASSPQHADNMKAGQSALTRYKIKNKLVGVKYRVKGTDGKTVEW